VNSFNNPYCLLASSSNDFKDGITFCELMSNYSKKSGIPGASLDSPITVEKSLHNIDLAMQEVKKYRSLDPKITPQEIYNNEDVMYEFLKIIKSIFEGKTIIPKLTHPAKPIISVSSQKSEVKPIKSPSFASLQEKSSNNSNPPPYFQASKVVAQKPPIPSSRQNMPLKPKSSPNIKRETSHEKVNSATNIQPKPFSTKTNSPKLFNDQRHSSVPISTELTPRIIGQRSSSHDERVSNTTQRKSSIKKAMTHQPSAKHSPIYTENVSPVKPSITTQWQHHESVDGGRIPAAAPRVDVKTKHKIIEWLQEISLIRKNAVSIAEFPSYCRNGVLLSDLICRLEGRQTKLKNIDRNPKTSTVVYANIRKCVEHLRSYEKMNSRFLWNIQDIIDGNADLIWGLLDDMWHFYHHKASPFDAAFSKSKSLESNTQTGRPSNSQTPDSSPFRKKTDRLNEYATPGSASREKSPITQKSTGYQNYISQTAEKSPLKTNSIQTMRLQTTQRSNSYAQIHSKSPIRNRAGSVSKRIDTSMDIPVNISSRSNIGSHRNSLNNSVRKQERVFEFPILDEEKERITRLWLKSLNLTVLSIQESEDMLKNPYRNGLLLCELIEILENIRIPNKIIKPIAVRQAQQNIQKALRYLFKAKPYSFPTYFIDSIECIQAILRGQRNAIWGLLNSIREAYPQTEPRNQPYLHLIGIELPYSVDKLRRLEISILVWLKALGVIPMKRNEDNRLVSILEIEHEIRNGTLLCEIAQILSGQHLHGIFKNPKTDATSLTNIRKALDCLRSLPRINPKYLWKEKEIFSGDRSTILGLLEELHKYYDGVSNDKSFVGPYLGLYFWYLLRKIEMKLILI